MHLNTKKNLTQLTQIIKESIKEIPLKMIQELIDIFRSRVQIVKQILEG